MEMACFFEISFLNKILSNYTQALFISVLWTEVLCCSQAISLAGFKCIVLPTVPSWVQLCLGQFCVAHFIPIIVYHTTTVYSKLYITTLEFYF